MAELAHADPFILKEKMGVIGAQLYASAWRIDRTDLAEEVLPKDKSLGNSQVLPRDYTRAWPSSSPCCSTRDSRAAH